MKKILIVVPSFNSGGTITSLLNVASSIDHANYDLYVYPVTNEGPNKESVSKYCKIIGDATVGPRADLTNDKKLKIKHFLKDVYKKIKIIGIDLSSLYFKREIKKIENYHFDVVIAFQEGTATRFVSMMPFSTKVAWVRSEYSRYLKLTGNPDETPIYDKYDKIVSVSRAATNNFLSVFPKYKRKTLHIYNLINAERILNLSEENVDYNKDEKCFNIISIGRIDAVKRFGHIPEIAKDLTKRGFAIKWLIIGGYSPQNEHVYDDLKNAITEYGMTSRVILVGQKNNPYPYLKRSDLLVSLSSSETFNNTLTEAKILGIPVVTTNYECAYESIKEETDGLIVPLEGVKDAITRMISDKVFYHSLRNNLSIYRYNGKHILNEWHTKILS